MTSSCDHDGPPASCDQDGLPAHRDHDGPPAYCDHCGSPADEGGHAACLAARAMEPPRYCPRCRRRMVVQVTPLGWSARCVEHGTLSG
ncbi:hypothetical protein HS041_31010 [Planomonospora sp. ID67723]|uniref:biotin synthase auxiliary protein BsaP n=1 Tax=Planomonospora sp. ID67723 TaxID=2738134 RepID=UPI0018C4227F|nr:hypothetical protein [Planomonospora sp. ID67723]MBG0832139.1 hypothetical protein [Planomonospora sp. ID67723]